MRVTLPQTSVCHVSQVETHDACCGIEQEEVEESRVECMRWIISHVGRGSIPLPELEHWLIQRLAL